MDFDIAAIGQGVQVFYLELSVLAALVGTVPGALVEKKTCATLERFHFLLFFFGGGAVLLYLHSEILLSVDPANVWKANAGMAFAAGLYLGNVTARRLRNAAKKPILALLIWVPVVNVVFMGWLALVPTAPKKAVVDTGLNEASKPGHFEPSA